MNIDDLIGSMIDRLPLSPDQFLSGLERIRRNQPYLKSRFNSKLEEGTLNSGELREYAIYLYNQSREFPTYIASQLARCPYPLARRRLATQILEEVGANVLKADPAYRFDTKWDNRPHDELAKAFADELGVPEEHLDNPTLDARRWMELRFNLSNQGWLIGCAINNFMTEKSIAESRPVWLRSLRNFYGVRSAKGLAFHRLHSWVDLRHGRIGEDLLRQYALDENKQREILKVLPDYFDQGMKTFDSFVRD
jgi:pyrroloquinoline quinone (PQQ) biosynthesis protein C